MNTPVPPDAGDRPPLSLNQEFLYAFDKGETEGAFGHRHTLVYGWRLRGPVDVDVLRRALDDVVARHEVLRTSLVHTADEQFQRIHPPSPVRLTVRDLPGDPDPAIREGRAEEFLNELDADVYPMSQLPHLRAILGRFDPDEAVLVLAAHHVATDPWSIGLIVRDLADCYAARKAGEEPGPYDGGQYRAYALWQRTPEAAEAADRARAYWRAKLDGARILGLPTDRLPQPDVPSRYAVHRFVIDSGPAARTLALARSMRSSPFMVLLAAYYLLLHRRTGASDLVVPTFTSGRYRDEFTRTVGPFYNFVPLRTDLTGCETFRDVLSRTRQTCIDAYTHDIPFSQVLPEAPELLSPFANPGLAVAAFELLQSPAAMDDERVGDLTYTEIRRRVRSQERSSDIPDGVLWAIDLLPSGELAGSVKFNPDLFDRATWVRFVDDFVRVLGDAVADPDLLIRDYARSERRAG
jgi:non-ribosomal peptide synthetase component F